MTEDKKHPLDKPPVAVPKRKRRERTAEQRAAAGRRMAAKQADSMPVVAPVDGPRRERQVDGPLVSPAPKGGLLEVIAEPYLLKLIVRRQLAQMYSASVLGLLWSYIQPAIRFLVYYFVMGVVLHQNAMPFFAIHLFCGIVFVHYFTETFSGGTRSIWSNKALVQKMRMPRETFPVAAMLVAAYHTFPQLVILAVSCALIGWHGDWYGVAAGVLGFLIIMSFGMALALLFSAANVFYRDFQNIVQTVTQFMHFMVPMMYPVSRVIDAAKDHPVIYQLYMGNPVAEAVVLLQRFFWDGLLTDAERAGPTSQFPEHMMQRGLITLVVCLVFLYFAQQFFSKLENKFPERM